MEDKQKICDLLCKTLQATRNHSDLQELIYRDDGRGNETVAVIWETGTRQVNVSLDSGTAMIKDIMRAIG